MGWWRSLFPLPAHGAEVERALRGVRPTRIAETKPGGTVAIAGVVEAIAPVLRAPLSWRPCVYWAVSITEVMITLQTVELANLDGGDPFFLVDGDVRARVIPEGARVAAPKWTELRAVLPLAVSGPWGGLEPPPAMPHERVLLESIRPKIIRTSRIRFTEYVIEAGAQVLVRGASDTEPEPESAQRGYRDLGQRLVVASARRRPLQIRVTPADPADRVSG